MIPRGVVSKATIFFVNPLESHAPFLPPNNTLRSLTMYVVEILNTETKTRVGPCFFVGDTTRGEFRHLNDARTAAKKWLETHHPNNPNLKIVSHIVGCL